MSEAGRWVVRVEGCNEAGCGPGVNGAVSVAPPPPNPPARPTGLAVSIETGSLDLSVDWEDTESATSYLVRWREAGSGNELNQGVTVESSSTTITLAESGRWVVRVEACNDDGCGPGASQMVSVVPLRPGNLALEDTGNLGVSASWETAAGADEYKVRWRLNGADFQEHRQATVAETAASFIASEPGDWEVRVEACHQDIGCGLGTARHIEVELVTPCLDFAQNLEKA